MSFETYMVIVAKGQFFVRQLKASELTDVVDLWKKARLPFRTRGRDSLSSLRTQMKHTPDFFLGAFEGPKLIGVVLASDDGRRGWINRLAVRPDARRHGVGTALMRAAEDALRRKGRRLFCVHVERGNEASMRLLDEAGYRREEDIFYYAKREKQSY